MTDEERKKLEQIYIDFYVAGLTPPQGDFDSFVHIVKGNTSLDSFGIDIARHSLWQRIKWAFMDMISAAWHWRTYP